MVLLSSSVTQPSPVWPDAPGENCTAAKAAAARPMAIANVRVDTRCMGDLLLDANKGVSRTAALRDGRGAGVLYWFSAAPVGWLRTRTDRRGFPSAVEAMPGTGVSAYAACPAGPNEAP